MSSLGQARIDVIRTELSDYVLNINLATWNDSSYASRLRENVRLLGIYLNARVTDDPDHPLYYSAWLDDTHSNF